jgi:hypothetical protein
MRQRARLATVVLALWGAAAGAGAFACGDDLQLDAMPEVPDSTPPAPLMTENPDTPPEPASTSDDGSEQATENGQTGSLHPVGCSNDDECAPVLETWAAGDAEYVLIDSACEQGPSGAAPYRDVVPECVCDVSVTRTVRDWRSGEVSRQTIEELWFLAREEWLRANAGPQCLVGGGVPGACAYCDDEFPGCRRDANVNDCAAPCADVVERLQTAAQVEHEVELRVARCTDTGSCEVALRIDDDCYNQDWVPSSCSLSDAEIIAAVDAPNQGNPCVTPELLCESAADCPAGLACDGSVCGACLGPEDGCSAEEGSGRCRREDFLCGDGEACIAGVCLATERAECFASADCPTRDPERDPRVCLLSGVDNQSGRGNEQTRSYCTSLHPNSFGLRLGDVLEASVLGPGDAVASTFEPALQLPDIPCGGGTGLAPGEVLRMRVDVISELSLGTEFSPRATLLDAGAPVEVPAPVHPRDPAAGRELWNKLSSSGNSAVLVHLARREPTTLRGCPGERDMWMTSLFDQTGPGVTPREDGTFPTTLLAYRFSVTDDGAAACAAFPEFSCTETVQVEVTRLTP